MTSGASSFATVGIEILQDAQLLGVLTGIGLDVALKIKALFTTLGSDFEVNIKNYGSQAIVADQDTVATVNAWLKSKGLPPVTAGGDGTLPPETPPITGG